MATAASVGSPTQTIQRADLPEALREMHSPPQQLYLRETTPGNFRKLMQHPRVAVVGTRRVTPYGRAVTSQLATELAAQGVVIISGLALGVDSIAHQSALDAKGLTMAVLPTPVEDTYPPSHWRLARSILDNGGTLLSEYPVGMPALRQNFIARNRIVSGLADVLLVTEATEDSGTTHTVRFAKEQGVTVLAVPGNINSPTSVGTNNLIKEGAKPVTDVHDVLEALGYYGTAAAKMVRVRGGNADEQCIIDLLEQGITKGSELLERSGFSIEHFNHNLTMLEITAKIRPLGGNQWSLR